MNLNFNFRKTVFFSTGIVIFLAFFNFFFLAPSENFPIETSFEVKEGMSLRSISANLKEDNLIKSRVAFETLVIAFGGEKKILQGEYLFEYKSSVVEVARRISNGNRSLISIRITIPEGFNLSDINKLASSKLPSFNSENFLLLTQGKEGYLFPDTYFLFKNDTEGDLVKLMSDNFEKKFDPLRNEIQNLDKKEEDIIVMASIVEREAKGDDDRDLISGILWKRISIDMPLQVDVATITYKEKGLPEFPIANSGLKAIKAAMYPKSSPYLYYLHSKDGVIHYAKSFEEHKRNIKKYLK